MSLPNNIFTDDPDNYHHLPTFEDVVDNAGNIIKKGMRDVESLIAVFTMAIFMNVLDPRTYIPFAQAGATPTVEQHQDHETWDFNGIPLVERRHCCYVRGLAFDLLNWFFNRFQLFDKDGPVSEPYAVMVNSFVGCVAKDMLRYKMKATEAGIPGYCTTSAFREQINLSLSFSGMRSAFDIICKRTESERAKDEYKHNRLQVGVPELPFRLQPYPHVKFHYARVDDYFKDGRNWADNKYFSRLRCKTLFVIIFAVPHFCFLLDASHVIDEESASDNSDDSDGVHSPPAVESSGDEASTSRVKRRKVTGK
jgi:hypothetical protein